MIEKFNLGNGWEVYHHHTEHLESMVFTDGKNNLFLNNKNVKTLRGIFEKHDNRQDDFVDDCPIISVDEALAKGLITQDMVMTEQQLTDGLDKLLGLK